MNGTLDDLEVSFDTLGSEEKMLTKGSGLSVVSLVTMGKVISLVWSMVMGSAIDLPKLQN